jgi:hypothetical protein
MHLDISVTDSETRSLLPCRLSFHGEDLPPIWGKDAGGQNRVYQGPPRIWCDGHWKGELPDLPLTLIVARPYEYNTATIQVEPAPEHRLEIHLKRRCNLPAAGWHCGDAHQHVVHGEALLQVDLPAAAAVARAEGTNWMVFDGHFTSIPGAEKPSPSKLDRLCAESSSPDFLALWADEYPKHDLGHLACFPFGQTTHPAEIAGEGIYRLEERAHTPYTTFESIRTLQRHGTTAVYVHPPRELGGTPGRVGNIARELPLDLLVAPWAIEAIDLMTDRIDDPVLWKMWHMLLNQGHRIGLCAFNDACYDRAGEGWSEPVAYRRTYAHIDGQPTWRNLVTAIRSGRTFGTTGPLLLFDIDGEGPGQIFPANGTHRTARIRAWGSPLYHDPTEFGSITRVAIIRNGETWKECDFADSPREAVELEFPVTEETTAWYVARIEGSVEKQLAVTSPIYFEGKDYRKPEPYPTRIRAHISDAHTGAPLSGKMELIEFAKDRIDVVETREFRDGEFSGEIPGDLRLRAAIDGYEPQTLSPILDCERIYRDLLGGIRGPDLADPDYYARLRRALDEVELNFTLNGSLDPSS